MAIQLDRDLATLISAIFTPIGVLFLLWALVQIANYSPS